MIKESEIGKNIHRYRKARNLTLQDVSDATGYSKGYLSKLEKSDTAPPVGTLTQIGKTLGVTMSALLGESAHKTSICLVKRNERIDIVGQGTTFGYAYKAIAYNYPNRHMQPFILNVPYIAKEKLRFQHNSEEMLFVLQGTMKFYHGDKTFIIEEGDCLYFDGNIPHNGVPYGEQEVVCLMVLSDS
ncbi:MAG: helix-turn-helix transcriptional regulator [Deltaproteobacteria bacterium]|nr:helix-turn-helix transcriptional regulator [Deltaproteobacteria bacterium]